MTGLAIGVVALVVAVAVDLRERRRRRYAATAGWWPWLIGAIEREVDVGAADLPTATVRAFLGGPPPLRSAAERAIRATGAADPAVTVGALRGLVGTAAGDRVLGTVADVHRRGVPAGTALAWARADAAIAALHDDDLDAETASGTAARWSLLLAPLVPAMTGRLPGVAGWAVATAAIGLWWVAGRWLHAHGAPAGPARHAERRSSATRATSLVAGHARLLVGVGTGGLRTGPGRRQPWTAAGAPLVGRLRSHVLRRYDRADEGWWAPPPRPAGRTHGGAVAPTRAGELAEAYDRLAVLLDAGDRFADAATQVARAGRGVVAAELHAVADAVRAGDPPAAAVFAWARHAGCSAVGALAADLWRASSADDVVATLRHHAGAHRRAAHRQHIRSVRRRSRSLWLLAVAVAVAAAVVVLM